MNSETQDIISESREVIFDTQVPLENAYFILEGKVDIVLTLGKKH